MVETKKQEHVTRCVYCLCSHLLVWPSGMFRLHSTTLKGNKIWEYGCVVPQAGVWPHAQDETQCHGVFLETWVYKDWSTFYLEVLMNDCSLMLRSFLYCSSQVPEGSSCQAKCISQANKAVDDNLRLNKQKCEYLGVQVCLQWHLFSCVSVNNPHCFQLSFFFVKQRNRGKGMCRIPCAPTMKSESSFLDLQPHAEQMWPGASGVPQTNPPLRGLWKITCCFKELRAHSSSL